jgi:hypothetical protein
LEKVNKPKPWTDNNYYREKKLLPQIYEDYLNDIEELSPKELRIFLFGDWSVTERNKDER